MAAVKKINKEGLLDAAYELVRKEGLESLSARKLAKEAKCSTQPIYDSFQTMDAIVKVTEEKMKAEYEKLKKEVADLGCADFSEQGIAIIAFAEKERILFRHFVIEDSNERDSLFDCIDYDGIFTNDSDCDAVKIIKKKMKDYIMGVAALVSEGYEFEGRAAIVSDIQSYCSFLMKKYMK